MSVTTFYEGEEESFYLVLNLILPRDPSRAMANSSTTPCGAYVDVELALTMERSASRMTPHEV